MKNLKVLIFSLIFLVANYFAALADITASTPSNMISSIASSSSFTSLDQNGAQAQNVTDNLLDSEQLEEEVQSGAETFGAQQNDTTLVAAVEEEQLVVLNKTKVPGLEYPEPNLDTIVYDTGLMTLTANTSAQYNSGLGDDGIFSGEQKARVQVYVDFVRQKQWGFVESHITLNDTRDASNDLKTMRNIFDGGARTVTELPIINSQLTHTINSKTAKPLTIDLSVEPGPGNDENPYTYDKHSINSILQDNSTPTIALYLANSPENFANTRGARLARIDFANAQKSISHGDDNAGVGDMGVLVQAQFSTGAGGALGTSTASFEVSNAGKCAAANTGCTAAEIETIKTSIIRLEATATTRAAKYIGKK